MIKLIVGLGNPGMKYELTRHNAGFWMVDLILEKIGASLCNEENFCGNTSSGKLGKHNILFLKPKTFMNCSGLSVISMANFYKIFPNQILVIHDELELAPGTTKFKFGGGTGGHRGLKNICMHLGTRDYWRLRIGIGHPKRLDAYPGLKVSDFVLEPPGLEEREKINKSINQAVDTLTDFISKKDQNLLKQSNEIENPAN